MIFVDSNVPMYLRGADHPLKAEAVRLLERCTVQREKLVTDAEVLQEILHRYAAIRQYARIPIVFEQALAIIDEVLPITQRDVVRAKDILLATPRLTSRDAIHLAIMEHHGIRTILSFDRDFDGIPGITRMH